MCCALSFFARGDRVPGYFNYPACHLLALSNNPLRNRTSEARGPRSGPTGCQVNKCVFDPASPGRMGKKDKRIGRGAEVGRLTSLHSAPSRTWRAQAAHATLSSECEDLKSSVKRASKDAADRKRDLAERIEYELKERSRAAEIGALKSRVEEAEEATKFLQSRQRQPPQTQQRRRCCRNGGNE